MYFREPRCKNVKQKKIYLFIKINLFLMLDMHNYIFILCMNTVFIQNIIVLFEISVFPYLFPNFEITNVHLWRLNEHSLAQINVSAFDVSQ